MDVVYVLGKGSVLNDFEIRMSLRSLEKNLSRFDQVWVIGDCPDFLQNINHVQFADNKTKVPDFNIAAKLTEACKHVTGDILFVNDDHFLLQPFDTATFPTFYYGMLDEYVRKRGLDGYGKRANNTLKYLQANNLPIKYFDTHTPIVFNRDAFLEHVSAIDWVNYPDGFIIKSLYANCMRIEGTEEKDNKTNVTPSNPIKIMSTHPHMKSAITRFLTEQFPEKSRFERTGL